MSHPATCPTCGAAHAPDQRYCLDCGTRVAAPRVAAPAERERVDAEARDDSAALSRLDRIGGPMGVAAVVLVALGIGFLAGRASDDAPPAQTAPVVTIESALPTAGATAPASDPPAGGDAEATSVR